MFGSVCVKVFWRHIRHSAKVWAAGPREQLVFFFPALAGAHPPSRLQVRIPQTNVFACKIGRFFCEDTVVWESGAAI